MNNKAVKAVNRLSTPSEHPFTWGTIKSLKTHKRTWQNTLSELVDNSIDANATEIDIKIVGSNNVERVEVLDNGHGMNYEALKESFGIGETNRPRCAGETGKFGMGGTMSCLARANQKLTVTKQAGLPVIARMYDTELVKKEDRWLTYSVNEGFDFPASYESGTLIILDRMVANERASSVVSKVKAELGQTFYTHLKAFGLSISVNGDPLQPVCPVGRDLPGAKTSKSEKLYYNGKLVGEAVEIDLSGFYETGEKAKQALTKTAGVYIMRNERVIARALLKEEKLTKNVRHPSLRFARVLLKITEEHDEMYGITNDKQSVDIDQGLADFLCEEFSTHFANMIGKAKNVKTRALAQKTKESNEAAVSIANGKHVRPRVKAKRKSAEDKISESANSTVTDISSVPTRVSARSWLKGIDQSGLGQDIDPWTIKDQFNLIFNTDNPVTERHYTNGDPGEIELFRRLAIAVESAKREEHLSDDFDKLQNEAFLKKVYSKLRAMTPVG